AKDVEDAASIAGGKAGSRSALPPSSKFFRFELPPPLTIKPARVRRIRKANRRYHALLRRFRPPDPALRVARDAERGHGHAWVELALPCSRSPPGPPPRRH